MVLFFRQYVLFESSCMCSVREQNTASAMIVSSGNIKEK